MPNVNQVIDLIEQLESTKVSVTQKRCVAVRHRKSACQKCVDACVVDCITVAENEVSIDSKACVGCGVCATVCPTEALSAETPTDIALSTACDQVAQNTEGVCTIACKPVLIAAKGLFDVEKVVGVTCLGRINPSMLVDLAVGEATKISLVKGKCDTCEWQKGIEVAERSIDIARVILDAYGNPVEIKLGTKFPSCTKTRDDKKYDTEKRGFFSGMGGEARTALSKTTDYAVKQALNIKEEHEPRFVRMTENGTLPQEVPPRRTLLLEDLSIMGDPQPEVTDEYLWGELDIDFELCTSCRMCATFCPTGSLVKFDEERKTFGLEQTINICVACDSCVDICPSGALSISHTVRLSDIAENAITRFEMTTPHNPYSEISKAFKTDYVTQNRRG